MKIILGKQRRRAWVLWAFLVVIAATVALCKVLLNMANQVPDPPKPPPDDSTNNPPSTNFVPRQDIAMMFKVAEGTGDAPWIASITYALMPSGDGVVLAIVDHTAPSQTVPGPMDGATWTNRCRTWLNDWGIDVDGSRDANWAAQGYIGYPFEDGLYHWAYLMAEQPGAPVNVDYNTFTYTTPAAPSNAPAYSVTIQRSADPGMANLTNLDTKQITVGQFQTFLDYGAPASNTFYRVAYHQQ